jgi:hypothetical protein
MPKPLALDRNLMTHLEPDFPLFKYSCRVQYTINSVERGGAIEWQHHFLVSSEDSVDRVTDDIEFAMTQADIIQYRLDKNRIDQQTEILVSHSTTVNENSMSHFVHRSITGGRAIPHSPLAKR